MSRDQDDVFADPDGEDRGSGRAVIAAVAVLLLCGAGWGLLVGLRAKPAALTASRGRVTLAEAEGEQPVFDPRSTPEIWYRVLLTEAALGSRARLVGEWIDPRGAVVHRGAYDTKPIMHLPWETHVRYRLPADAMPGTWRVRLLAGDRELHAASFEVGGGAGADGGGS